MEMSIHHANCIAAALCALSASAMTYTEFRQAIDIAPDGGTVVLENDVEFDSALPEISAACKSKRGFAKVNEGLSL